MGRKYAPNRVSRERMFHALAQLTAEQPFSAITVTEIAERGGTSRMAYYRNYREKEDIVRLYFEDLIEGVLKKNGEKKDILPLIRDVLTALAEEAEAILCFWQASLGACFLEGLETALKMLFPEKEEKLYLPAFWGGALYGVCVKWIEGGMKESPDALADLCCRVAASPAKAL